MLEFHDAPLCVVAWQPQSDRLASADEGGYVVIWEPERLQTPLAVYYRDAAVTGLVWCPQGVGVAHADGAGVRHGAVSL